MSSCRRRNCLPLMAAGSFDRSVVERTTSLTPFAAAVLGFCPWPSATRLSAGHSPAVAMVAAIENTPAIAVARATRRHFDPVRLVLLLMVRSPLLMYPGL